MTKIHHRATRQAVLCTFLKKIFLSAMVLTTTSLHLSLLLVVHVISSRETASRIDVSQKTSTKRVFSAAGDVIATFTGNTNLGSGSATALEAGVCRITVLYHQLPIAGA